MDIMASEAVVVIDVQNAILDIPGMKRPAETHAAFDGLVGRIAAFVERVRSRGIPVLFVQHDGQPGHRLERGLPGWQIRRELAPIRDEVVIHKTACDAFFKTTLESELGSRSIHRLIVAGCMTQYCVDTSVRRAVSLGYDVTLAEDGHLTADSEFLTFDQNIAHHNALLDGFDAGEHSVRVEPFDRISL
jgi:nicotinamidase-related amidase